MYEQDVDELRRMRQQELENLRARVTHENNSNDALEKSLVDLQLLVDNLDKRVEDSSLDEVDSNEWRTRYEMQVETNNQLELQARILEEKVEEAKQHLRDYGKMSKNNTYFDEHKSDSEKMKSLQYLKTLERSKGIFESQLRDLEWRLEQEDKAYYKTNAGRKVYEREAGKEKSLLASARQEEKQQIEQITRRLEKLDGVQEHRLWHKHLRQRAEDKKQQLDLPSITARDHQIVLI